MSTIRFTFSKLEKLTGEIRIGKLFKEGKSLYHAPFSLVWKISTEPQPFPARVLIIAPKRNFKRAVDRNLIKRHIREAYRHLKPEFYNRLGENTILFAIRYNAKEIVDSAQFTIKLNEALSRLTRKIENHVSEQLNSAK